LQQELYKEATALAEALQKDLDREMTAKEAATNASAQKAAEAEALQQQLRCEMAAKEEASARVDALQEELYCERTAKEEATNARAQKEAEAQTLQQELRCEMIAKEQTANAIAEKAPQAEALQQELHCEMIAKEEARAQGLQFDLETLKKQVAAARTHKFALEHEVVWLTAEKQKLLDQKLTLSALSEDSSSADDQVMQLRAKLAQFTTRYNESSAKRTGLQKKLLHQRKRCEVVADAMVAAFTGPLEQKVNSPATESRLSPPSRGHATLSQEEKLAKQIISILSGTSADLY